MARLSVNLNKIALLRNSRRTGVPDLRAFARVALEAGARGITVHPRPDERHIRRSDVPMLAETIAALRRMRSLPRKASNSAQSRWRWCALLSRR
jgi:pyridoxine 5-phosphate synthase